MITVNDIRFSYGKYPVLSVVSFNVENGELCVPNGAGKTTLFRCCLGF